MAQLRQTIHRTIRKTISVFLIACALLIGSFSSNPAIAEPVTPEAAQYEIDHAKSAEEAGKRIQQQAEDYKDELAEDTQYTKHAVKNAAKRSQESVRQTTETIQGRLDETVPQGTKEFLNDAGDKAKDSVNAVKPRGGYYSTHR